MGPLELDVSVTTDEHAENPEFPELDPLLLNPELLSVMAAFATSGWYQVKSVREGLGLPTDDMARHVAQLRNTGCVNTRVGSDSVEWMQITRPGAVRLAGHLAAMQDTLTSVRRLMRSTWPQ
jgi:hypothetical protein